jgi:peptide deformylase
LRTHAEPVDVGELARGDLNELVETLRDTLRATGSRCIAAPQIGAGVQMLVFRPREPISSRSGVDLRVVANPMIEPEHGDLVHDWEDCLSIPKILGLVPRHPRVRVRGVDESGQPVDFQAEGQDSRVIQHANDHLSGVVFLDRMRDLRSLSYDVEWKQYLAETDIQADESG